MPATDVHHFACHAVARPAVPLDSALILAKGAPLTLRDVLALKLAGSRLVVLSGCDTQIPGDQLPDEVVGLPAGLLEAGAAGVIASHWRVYDTASALLMARFYRGWLSDGQSPSEALRQAQRWLRDTTNAEKADDLTARADRRLRRLVLRGDPERRDYAHPHQWAAFSYTGA
jgi:CHAT domain-containing protein